jgi:serine/threonine-protein kinase HipA
MARAPLKVTPAFWNGQERTLTPAYDICPRDRTGNEATQAMFITGENRFSQLKTCLAAARHFLPCRQAAVDAIDRIETAIRDSWERVFEEVEFGQVSKNFLWGRQFLDPFSVER